MYALAWLTLVLGRDCRKQYSNTVLPIEGEDILIGLGVEFDDAVTRFGSEL